MSISNTGVKIDPSSTALTEARQILTDTYGPSVNIDPASPNGLLIQAIAIAITQREIDQADTVGSMNPQIATGTQLDAICANLDIIRDPATKSTATCQFGGLAGVTIPAGSLVSSVNNDIFSVDSTIVIGGGGTVSGTVTAQNTGPIQVVSNTIKTIITAINGWDTVNNSSSGSVGKIVQSDTELRRTRISQLAFASSGSLLSILAGAQAMNPTSVYVTENTTSSNEIIDGITILAKSILMVIDGGGSDSEIAEMFLQRLSGGCAMSGTSTFTIPIPNSPNNFTANWQVATQRALGLNLTLKLGSIYPPNLPDFIANIINTEYDFNVIGRYIDATEFVYLLIANGILGPIRSLTFNVGVLTDLTEYNMPISDSLGSSIDPLNISIDYV